MLTPGAPPSRERVCSERVRRLPLALAVRPGQHATPPSGAWAEVAGLPAGAAVPAPSAVAPAGWVLPGPAAWEAGPAVLERPPGVVRRVVLCCRQHTVLATVPALGPAG